MKANEEPTVSFLPVTQISLKTADKIGWVPLYAMTSTKELAELAKKEITKGIEARHIVNQMKNYYETNIEGDING